MEDVKRIVLRAGQHLSKEETLSLRGTKALSITQYRLTERDIQLNNLDKQISLNREEVATWSAIVRNALEMLKEPIRYVNANINTASEFIGIFEKSLKDICDGMNFKLNSNCPKRLYKDAEEDDLINSKVYKSNKNHLLPVIVDEDGTTWYMCAVYTQEIVVMLETLLDTIYYMAEDFTQYRDRIDEFPQTIFVLEYMERETNDRDSEHYIVDSVELDNGAELHHFNNEADIPYSAIYVNGEEIWSCPRADEFNMIKRWNGEEYNTVEEVDKELQRLNMAKDLLLLQSKVSKLSTALLEIYADINDIQEKYNLPTADEILKNK